MKTAFISILFIASISLSVFADEEVGRSTYIVTNKYGNYYAKSVPKQGNRTSGETRVFSIRDDEDKLNHTYDFYSDKIYLSGKTIAAFGPWPRGIKPNKNDIALSFYTNGKMLKSYSTQDIYDLSKRFTQSKSHYSVFKFISGVITVQKEKTYSLLKVTLHNDEEVLFDFNTGNTIIFESKDKVALGLLKPTNCDVAEDGNN